MRKTLGKRLNERDTFKGCFERYGTKPGWRGSVARTLLLVSILDKQGRQVCDHLWFNLTKGMNALNLQPGDVVEFDARVSIYHKGHWHHHTVDYQLSYPTKVKKVS